MSEWTIQTLKEHLETRFCANEKLFREYVDSTKEALEKQAREYERRLESLNGEHDRISKAQSSFVNREIFEEWKSRMDVFVASNTGRAEGIGKTTAVIYAVVVLAASVLLPHLWPK